MTTVTITIDSREVVALLNRAPERINRALRAAMDDSVDLLHRDMITYPARHSRKPNPGEFVSERQRRFVMASIRDGRIKFPFKRTNTLKNSWQKRITGTGTSITGEVVSSGATAPYNRLVQDRDRQARMHQGNWATVQTVTERRRTTIQRYFDRRLREEFSR